MRQISNSDMRTILRHLPRILPAVNTGGDNRIYNSARLLYLLVRKWERAERAGRDRRTAERISKCLNSGILSYSPAGAAPENTLKSATALKSALDVADLARKAVDLLDKEE